MLFIIFVLMNEIELLVHGREVTLEQQKAVHARVIWYVPCRPVVLQALKYEIMGGIRGYPKSR